jgi:hypothetical protein
LLPTIDAKSVPMEYTVFLGFPLYMGFHAFSKDLNPLPELCQRVTPSETEHQ